MVTTCRTGLSNRGNPVDAVPMDTLEHRANRRSPTWLHAVVTPESDSSGRGALVLDISMGGAAIELGGWADDNRGMLGLLGDGLRYIIPFVVVGKEATLRGAVIHVKFVGIDPRCKNFLADTLAAAEAEFVAAQKHLARRQA